METHELICHPDTAPVAVKSVTAMIVRNTRNCILVRWRIKGARSLVVPERKSPGRADGLWQTTCFEVFLRKPSESGYVEFNSSPSGDWAAYDFTGYRQGMSDRSLLREPASSQKGHLSVRSFDFYVHGVDLPPRPLEMGLSAVIEERGGHKSFWALAHPSGKPDFHHAACFAASLPAPYAP